MQEALLSAVSIHASSVTLPQAIQADLAAKSHELGAIAQEYRIEVEHKEGAQLRRKGKTTTRHRNQSNARNKSTKRKLDKKTTTKIKRKRQKESWN